MPSQHTCGICELPRHSLFPRKHKSLRHSWTIPAMFRVCLLCLFYLWLLDGLISSLDRATWSLSKHGNILSLSVFCSQPVSPRTAATFLSPFTPDVKILLLLFIKSSVSPPTFMYMKRVFWPINIRKQRICKALGSL